MLSIVHSRQDMDLQRAFESYQTAKINNIKPNAMTFANLLSLTAGFGDQGEFRNGCLIFGSSYLELHENIPEIINVSCHPITSNKYLEVK